MLQLWVIVQKFRLGMLSFGVLGILSILVNQCRVLQVLFLRMMNIVGMWYCVVFQSVVMLQLVELLLMILIICCCGCVSCVLIVVGRLKLRLLVVGKKQLFGLCIFMCCQKVVMVEVDFLMKMVLCGVSVLIMLNMVFGCSGLFFLVSVGGCGSVLGNGCVLGWICLSSVSRVSVMLLINVLFIGVCVVLLGLQVICISLVLVGR